MTELRGGSTFGAYRIERKIGQGGMGIVYEAAEPALHRRVALKLISGDLSADPLFADRFARESRIAAAVEHPNVVPIYAVGEEDGVAFIAMRLIGGLDLGRKIAELRHLEAEDAAGLIAQVAAGLDAIHAAGLIHRDVKPSNILLGGDEGREHAYITDFGLAKQVASESELSRAGLVVGTLDYLSPEQIEHRPVDASADVYALGCVLHKALTGSVPFERDTNAAMMWAHVNDDPPAPSETAGVPAAFDAVIARAMSKRPEDRYPSAGDLGRAALAAASGRPVTEPERRVARGAASAPGLMIEDREGSTGDLARHYSDLEPTPTLDPPSRGRRRLRALAPLLIGLAVGVIAGLAIFLLRGGGGSADQQLITRADEICTESRALYNEAAKTTPKSTAAAARQAEALLQISERALRSLRRLRPPEDLARRWNVYLGLRAGEIERLRAARDAALRADAGAYKRVYGRIDDSALARFQAARDIGLQQCSRGS